MRFYLRQTAESRIDGPHDLREVSRLVATGAVSIRAEVIEARGQTGFQLKRSREWQSISAYLDQTGAVLPHVDQHDDPARASGDGVDVRVVYSLGGLLIGGFVGFLLRPAVPILGAKLPFMTVITRGLGLRGFDAALIPLAEASFNHVLAGGIIGVIAGYVFAVVRPRGGISDGRTAAAAPSQAIEPTKARSERDCPWCAERVLTAARICKHCGREIADVGTS